MIGDEGLVHPGELVAVVGHKAGDPQMTVKRAESPSGTQPTKVSALTGTASTTPSPTRC